MSIAGVLDRVRQPEYTGANRCLPCTAVNVVLAATGSIALGVAWAPLGIAAFAVSLAAIYLRGYLVPGTPPLTKRYLPGRVLRWFEKDPASAPDRAVDVETALRELGAIEECPDRDDLCLAPAFHEEWVARLRDDGDTDTENLRLLGVDTAGEDISANDDGTGISVSVGGQLAGQWPSRAAHVADLAAAGLLRERDPRWDDRDRDWRAAVCESLRVFLETCPSCEGRVELGEERVESCCREIDVAAAECTDCGARLFETTLPDAQP